VLWIDGDHTYRGAKEDIDLFRPHLASGAIVALHDVLHTSKDRCGCSPKHCSTRTSSGRRACAESVGWAQYRPSDGEKWRDQRRAPAPPCRAADCVRQRGREPKGFTKLRYKLWRGLVPTRPRMRRVGSSNQLENFSAADAEVDDLLRPAPERVLPSIATPHSWRCHPTITFWSWVPDFHDRSCTRTQVSQ